MYLYLLILEEEATAIKYKELEHIKAKVYCMICDRPRGKAV